MATFSDFTSQMASIESSLKGSLTNDRLALTTDPYTETRIRACNENVYVSAQRNGQSYIFDIRATGNNYLDLSTMKFYCKGVRVFNANAANLPVKACLLNNFSQTCWRTVNIGVGTNLQQINYANNDTDLYSYVTTLVDKSSEYVAKNAEDIFFTKDVNSAGQQDVQGWAVQDGSAFAVEAMEARTGLVNNNLPFTFTDFVPMNLFKQKKYWPPMVPMRLEFIKKDAREVLVQLLPRPGGTAPTNFPATQFTFEMDDMVITCDTVNPSDESLMESIHNNNEGLFASGKSFNRTLEYQSGLRTIAAPSGTIYPSLNLESVIAKYPFVHPRSLNFVIAQGSTSFTYTFNSFKLRPLFMRMAFTPTINRVEGGNANPMYLDNILKSFDLLIEGRNAVYGALKEEDTYQFDLLERTQGTVYGKENSVGHNILKLGEFIRGGQTVYGIFTGYSGDPTSFEIATNSNMVLTLNFKTALPSVYRFNIITYYSQMLMITNQGVADLMVSI